MTRLLIILLLSLTLPLHAQISGPSMLSIPGDGAVQVSARRGSAPAGPTSIEELLGADVIFGGYAEDYTSEPGFNAVWPDRGPHNNALGQNNEVSKPATGTVQALPVVATTQTSNARFVTSAGSSLTGLASGVTEFSAIFVMTTTDIYPVGGNRTHWMFGKDIGATSQDGIWLWSGLPATDASNTFSYGSESSGAKRAQPAKNLLLEKDKLHIHTVSLRGNRRYASGNVYGSLDGSSITNFTADNSDPLSFTADSKINIGTANNLTTLTCNSKYYAVFFIRRWMTPAEHAQAYNLIYAKMLSDGYTP